MTMDDFCISLIPLKLSSLDQALAVIWFNSQERGNDALLPGRIARIIHDSGLGNPNSTQLGEKLRKSKHTLGGAKGYRLKPAGLAYISKKVASVCSPKAEVNQEQGYLPKHIWERTRGYIESVASQINGCYQYAYYDGASVLVRRLLETLLIEAFEYTKQEHRIRGQDGEYVMLSGIINDVIDRQGLSLGRDSKRSLKAIKEAGDRSAHNRRYSAGKADLDNLHSGLRVAVEELIQLAELQSKSDKSR